MVSGSSLYGTFPSPSNISHTVENESELKSPKFSRSFFKTQLLSSHRMVKRFSFLHKKGQKKEKKEVKDDRKKGDKPQATRVDVNPEPIKTVPVQGSEGLQQTGLESNL